MDYSNHYMINGGDCWTTWGVVFEQGTYAELLKKAKRKEAYSYSWPDENGTDRYLPEDPVFESRQLSLPVAIIASGQADFQTKLQGFLGTISGTGYFDFDAIDLNRRFKLIYDENTNLDIQTAVTAAGDVVAKFTISLIDDYPNTNNPIPAE